MDIVPLKHSAGFQVQSPDVNTSVNMIHWGFDPDKNVVVMSLGSK